MKRMTAVGGDRQRKKERKRQTEWEAERDVELLSNVFNSFK